MSAHKPIKATSCIDNKKSASVAVMYLALMPAWLAPRTLKKMLGFLPCHQSALLLLTAMVVWYALSFLVCSSVGKSN